MNVIVDQRQAWLAELLRCPATGQPMRRDGDAYVSTAADVRFPIDNGILRAFLAHDKRADDVSTVMEEFYSAHPFPNYDEMETVGSLIEKSLARGFPEMLNRSIGPHARVLEVGCGTGQLGNFLAIAGRQVLSADMTLNSLLLGEGFRRRSGLDHVAFAQMNLFRLPLQPAAFDVVICTGVLHHTNAPHVGFAGLVPLVRPGGHLIIGLYNLYGRQQTVWRARLARIWGEKVASLDPYLNSHQLAADKRRAWFMDQYRNPHESLHTMDELLRWFDEAGLEFVRGVPSPVFGESVDLDYRQSLFDSQPRGSRLDRLFSQVHQMITDTEGGLFVMVARKP
ncbi:MAG TPA: class I SAM-dependent methyltransferase [Reyranellaceae bacterium]|nr:class I SAM-dependent methyltransferase [Reyranellaceae bacterium]